MTRSILDTSRRLALMAVMTLAAGCNAVEVSGDEEEGGDRDTFFRHGTPPGPAPWAYGLTAYGVDDRYQGGTPACGGKRVDGTWYYATGAYTFGCGSRLRLEANGKCVVVAVVDNGPAGWVERKAQKRCGGTGYLIDGSPLASKHLFGTSSAGWSDCFQVQVSEVAESAAPGPVSCDVELGLPSNPAFASKSFIGDPCSDGGSCSGGLCFSDGDGFFQGTCSQSCQRFCPDEPGKPLTFCTDVGGEGRCVSRCDTSIYPGTGCRLGYRCVTMPRFSDPSVEVGVCLP